jgi:hypothetical protein
MSELPSLIPILYCLSNWGAPDTRVTKEFGIFTKSSMLNNLQSIAQENRSQLLNSPETDPVQYIANHSGIERLSKRYWVDVSYPETQIAYSRLTQRIQPTISSFRNEVQAHLKSTLLSRLMVSNLTPHTYSIHRPILTHSHSLLTYDPTSGMPLTHVCPLRIALERFILLHSKHIFSFLNALNLWLPALTECHLSDTKLFSAGAAHPARTQLILWIYASSVCDGRCLNSITVMLRVNLSVGGRCPPHAYLRCTALGDM